MRLSTLVRVGGAAAMLAGVLRAASSFASGGSEVERQALYFIVIPPGPCRLPSDGCYSPAHGGGRRKDRRSCPFCSRCPS
jgi:hypothetical protein